jgi:hypothetical protein
MAGGISTGTIIEVVEQALRLIKIIKIRIIFNRVLDLFLILLLVFDCRVTLRF